MATKKCPNCGSDCPVASSSCKKCLHVFKSRKGSSNSISSTAHSIQHAALTSASIEDSGGTSEGLGRRHTGRITRSKPNFYDSLHVEEQMRQQKLLLRKQLKQSKSEEDGSGASGGGDDNIISREKDSAKTGEPQPKKRKRGRPPGITGKKPTNAGRIAIHNKTVNSVKISNHTLAAAGDEKDLIDKDEDIMADITPEKALQYNIVLNEINRKWVSANWKVS